MYKLLRLSLLSLFLFLLTALPTRGQVNIDQDFPSRAYPDFGALVTNLLKNAYVIAGIIFLVLVVTQGISYLSAAGSDSKRLQQVQLRLLWSIIGLVVIIASYWIIQALEVLTGLTLL